MSGNILWLLRSEAVGWLSIDLSDGLVHGSAELLYSVQSIFQVEVPAVPTSTAGGFQSQ
jgi:hypothetical protein